MNKLPLFIIFFVKIIFAKGQYLGGNSDGNIFNTISNTNLAVADGKYNGGIADGNAFAIQINASLSVDDGLFNGGHGYGNISLALTNTALSVTDGLYNGGNGKGEDQLKQILIRLSPCNDQNLVWNGNNTVFWNNASNWDCGKIPINTSIVTIPANATRMPVIASSAIASRVTVFTNANLYLIGGASLLTLTGQ